MSEIFKHRKNNINYVEINSRHIPENEYQNLDEAFKLGSGHIFLACFYDKGVQLTLFDSNQYMSQSKKTKESFPVLFELIEKAHLEDISIIDLDESSVYIEGLKIYKWEDDEN